MKPFFFFLFSSFYLYGQNIEIKGVWHFWQGDMGRDSLSKIIQQKRIYLKNNEIVSLRVSSKTNIRYQYRVLNAENYAQWREFGSDGVLQLPTLVGGEYVVEITQIGIIQRSLQIKLYVSQPFWQKSWFWLSIIVYGLFLVGIGVYFFALYNFRQKLKVEQIRNRIAADLHDEVGSNLNSIAIFVELLRKKAPVELTEILDKIKNNSTETVQLMQDTIWAIQSENDDIERFIVRMKNFATEMLSAKNIALDFQVELPKKTPDFQIEQRKNMYLVFKEAINNIAKHSKATKSSVELRVISEELSITIIDNGKGFDTTQVFEGNGLRNFEERAEASEMTVKVSSEIGKGTRVVVVAFL